MTKTATPTAAELGVEVGDFFVASWGYDQTNVNFFEVVGITPSGKSVKLREVAKRTVSDNGPSTRVVPVPGRFVSNSLGDDRDSGPVTKRLRFWGGKVAIAFTSYASAWKWDGYPQYETGQGWGH